ncbi:hypothetical protein RCL1_000899 [Eukaryota sp. TZLM3-RCL]
MLKSRILKGEAASVNKSTVSEAIPKLLEVIKNYYPSDVFNMDETALFWRMRPHSTITSRSSLSGQKQQKERLTLGLAVNMDGTEKLPLVVIGTAQRPLALRNKEIPLNIDYRANKKGWMTQDVFKDWCTRLDEKLVREDRKILLILDNVSSHKIADEYTNTVL